MRILIVEDEASHAQLFRVVCERAGYVVLDAHNGRHALELLQRETVDLVIMDVVMPVMDGLTALGRIRSLARYRTLPVILATAQAMPAQVERLKAAGATDLLIKPFTRRELLACVARHADKMWLTTLRSSD